MVDNLTFAPTGRLDSKNAPDFQRELESIAQSGATVSVNLHSVEYLGSAAFRALLSTQRKLKSTGGEVLLTGVKGRNRKAIELSGFFELFKIYE